MDKLSKRLLALMQISTWLEGRDGHIWIEYEVEADWSLHDILHKHDVGLNSKIYGGVLEALDTIDAALELCGEKSLLEQYDENVQFLGTVGIDRSRISKTFPERGGIW